MLKQPLYRTTIGVILVYPLVAALAYMYGQYYGQIMIPLYSNTLKFVADDFDIKIVEVMQLKSQKVISVDLVNHEERIVGGNVLPANFAITASTLLGHALQHVILIATIMLTWMIFQLKSWQYNISLILLTTCGLLAVEMVDIPFVLFGSIQDLILFNLAPSQLKSSPAVTWMHILNGGGRFAISIVAGLIAIFLCQYLFKDSIKIYK